MNQLNEFLDALYESLEAWNNWVLSTDQALTNLTVNYQGIRDLLERDAQENAEILQANRAFLAAEECQRAAADVHLMPQSGAALQFLGLEAQMRAMAKETAVYGSAGAVLINKNGAPTWVMPTPDKPESVGQTIEQELDEIAEHTGSPSRTPGAVRSGWQQLTEGPSWCGGKLNQASADEYLNQQLAEAKERFRKELDAACNKRSIVNDKSGINDARGYLTGGEVKMEELARRDRMLAEFNRLSNAVTSTCIHQWIDTGFKKTWCKLCDQNKE